MKYAIDIKKRIAYPIDYGIQALVDAQGIYDGEEAEQFGLLLFLTTS
ncbi:hypothetical protein NYE37_13600 [Thermoactinomyces sp. FSL K6-2592]|jgi:hypothetical protein